MLKIKESVNLEILRDYGFAEKCEVWEWEYYPDQKIKGSSVMILIDQTTKRIMFSTWGLELGGLIADGVTERTTDKAMDVLYELIQSGIVEKMEDENE